MSHQIFIMRNFFPTSADVTRTCLASIVNLSFEKYTLNFSNLYV